MLLMRGGRHDPPPSEPPPLPAPIQPWVGVPPPIPEPGTRGRKGNMKADTGESAGAVAGQVDRNVRPDPERAAFEAWAAKRWGREAHRHTSATCAEWDAWQAAVAAERERCARKCESLKVRAPSYFDIDERLQEAADAIRA